MEVQMCAVDKIIPYARNPRKNDASVPKVKASIKEFGFQQPIVVDKEYVIIVGHTRYEAAKQLGYKEVPITIADKLTPQQAKAYRIADNKTVEYSMFDEELLILEIEDLLKDGYDLTQTAFSQDNIDLLLESVDMLPDKLPDLGIEGEDNSSGQFIFIYTNEEEKQFFIDKIGLTTIKHMYGIGDFEV